MGNRNLHNEFKEQLQPKEFELKNEFWEGAENMLNEAQPKPVGFFIKITGVLSVTVLALLAVTFTLSQKNNNLQNTVSNPKTTQPTTPLNNNAVADENKTDNTPFIEKQENKQNASTHNFEENTTPNQSSLPLATTTNENTINPQQEENTIKPYKHSGNTGFATENSEQKTNTSATQKNIVNTTLAVAEENSIDENSNPLLLKTDEGNEINSLDETLLPAEESITSTPNQNKTENSVNNESEVLNNNPSGEQTALIIPPAKPLLNSYFRVGFEMGISSLDRSLTTNLDDCIDYVNKRRLEEKPKLAYSANFNFGQQINRWQWQVGLGFLNYQEEINYNNEVLRNTGIDNGYWDFNTTLNSKVDSSWAIDSIFVGHWNFDTTIVTIIDSNYIEQWDTTITSQLDSRISANNGLHNLSYFEVPLFIGYTFGKNRWFLDVQPGVSVGFLTGSKGSRYINKDLSGLVAAANQTEQFRSVIWKAHFRVGVRYSMEKWEIGLYPRYSVTLNNILKTDQVLQRYQSLGVMMGVYYKL